MEASTTIKQMLAGNKISVPTYQRAYAWETELGNGRSSKQVNVFLSDLEDYIGSIATSPYYFGHFLFEKKTDNSFYVIDGQQRLTTIVIFLSALFTRLESIRELTEEEKTFKGLITGTYRFSTVDYDNRLFIDYVIEQTKRDHNGLDTVSATRIVWAFDYFTIQLSKKQEGELLQLLSAVQQATCTTHPVENESEAIQMFIFQNNRGKKPSDLEIIKAQFMYTIHLHAGKDKDRLIEEIRDRFEAIYKSISSIENKINEDHVLIYTQRVFFNSLWESDPRTRINTELAKDTRLTFIKEFAQSLTRSFEYLETFFGKDEENIEIHSLITLGGLSLAIPFIIKAYTFDVPIKDKCRLCAKLETLILRHKVIGTRADITSRINDVYQKFTIENPHVENIINHIHNKMLLVESKNWWWAYWNDEALLDALQGNLDHRVAKFLLWRYEHFLESKGKGGYGVKRYTDFESPELEHIAPQTENPDAGYDEYDEEFRNQYLDCLGNYLLISKEHNCSIGNKPFEEKYNTYTHLKQQEEVQQMAKATMRWTRDLIKQRQEKILEFVYHVF